MSNVPSNPDKAPKAPPTSFKSNPETDEFLKAAMERLKMDKSKTIRLAIKTLYDSLHEITRPDVAFSGSPETVDTKWKIIEGVSQFKGVHTSSFEAGVTSVTAEQWLKEDPLFGQFLRDAWNRAMEAAEHKLYYLGVSEGNVKGLTGILDAHNEQYGRPRRDSIKRQQENFIEKDLLPLLAKRLSPRDLDGIQREMAEKFQLGPAIAPDTEDSAPPPTPSAGLLGPSPSEDRD